MADLTRGKLLERLRIRLDDLVEPTLWSDNELLGHLADAEDEACLRADLILDTDTDSVCTINVVAGTAGYPLSPAITRIKQVVSERHPRPLERTTQAQLDHVDHGWASRAGVPTRYLLSNGNRTLILNRIPDANDTLTLTVYRRPLVRLDDEDKDDDSIPEIPSEYHAHLIDWAEHLAYLKRDTDVGDPERADQAAMRFTLIFGQRPDAETLERKLREPVRRVRGYFL